MKSTFVMFAAILSLVFVLPARLMVFTGLFISLLALIWDYLESRRTMINWAVLLVNVLVCSCYYLLGVESFLPYMGTFFYGAIALLAFGSILLRRPFTMARAPSNPWEYRFHVGNTLVVGLFQLAAIGVSFLLMPHIAYVILPMLISFSSVGLSHRIVKGAMEAMASRRAGQPAVQPGAGGK